MRSDWDRIILYTPEYAGMIKDRGLVEKLLTQGGIRLAAILNWIFAEVGEDELKRTYLTLQLVDGFDIYPIRAIAR